METILILEVSFIGLS